MNSRRVLGKSYDSATHTAVNVATSSGQVIAANVDRVYLLLQNISDTRMYIRFGETAVALEGVELSENGGSYEMSSLFGNVYTGAINAIHGGSGSKVLLVTEGE